MPRLLRLLMLGNRIGSVAHALLDLNTALKLTLALR